MIGWLTEPQEPAPKPFDAGVSVKKKQSETHPAPYPPLCRHDYGGRVV